MPGENVTFLSTDSADVIEVDGLHTVPAEYLHSLDLTGLPPSKLELKVGAPTMLLRNIDLTRGLYNDTYLVFVRIGSYMLQACLVNKPGAPIELIPRFTMATLEGDMPFMLIRKQFPVKLCFAMTINKSQGQPLKHVGIDLRWSSYSHMTNVSGFFLKIYLEFNIQ
ncbi:hypothetical protein G6F70_001097 [Rhizopus microsporus]|nr:hypothetical protein G6F71_001074 [Rhizopus microsporus]KAG1203721.1 hypothetical protein G6F70_001097 [Rhizopus microsporus]KAG1216386.1 hypothetical protein G6F69_000148 [Rhizopus microsporus]KAG1237676.1 hypothetical protein G6F67_000994 [Rhizopus microsporus]KAG1264821.1 hypothetical protein G6F68_004080 [Rhizopus microsporus]